MAVFQDTPSERDQVRQRSDNLSPARRALLERWMQGKGHARVQPTIPARAGDSPLLLSFAQERMWFVSRLLPGVPLYNMSGPARIAGRLKVDLLERSLAAVIERHEPLRTAFPMIDGRPVPVVRPPGALSLPVEDLSSLPDDAREAEVTRLAQEEAREEFDLATGPLLRLRLLRLADEEHVMLLTVHHIIADGWSIRLLVGEAWSYYLTLSQGRVPTPSPLPVQYADFAAWQRATLRGELLDGELDYWRQRLQGAPALLELPTDQPRAAAPSYGGAVHGFSISPGLSESIRAFSRRESMTPFMTLLAAFNVLLFRHSQQEDVVVGTPVLGRNWPEVEGLIGCFLNTVPLRTDLRGNPTFRELLRRVRESALGAFAHQAVPFERLVQALQPERNLGQSPIFQVMFNLRADEEEGLEATGGRASAHLLPRVPSGTAQVDLALEVVDRRDGFLGALEYRSALFDPATIARMAGQFEILLQAILTQPDGRIASLPLMSTAERDALTASSKSAGHLLAVPRCLHQVFEAAAEWWPGAIALVHEGVRVSYAALNDRADQIARQLRARGVGPEFRVGLWSDRGPELAAGLLGILKAGGACVPIERVTPTARVAWMLKDAGARLLLTPRSLATELPDGMPAVLCLEDAGVTDGPGSDELALPVAPDNLAYVIYTSGSTGNPKGVAVSHGAAVAHLDGIRRAFALDEHDVVLQFASIAFDVAIEQILATLCSGGQLVMRSADMWPPQHFVTKARELELTVANLPPAYWSLVTAHLGAEPEPPLALRLMVVGGDVLPPAGVRAWQTSSLGHVRLLNAYGPTEAVITAALHEVLPGAPDASLRTIPIGRPLAGRSAYVLDARGEVVPRGIVGELHLGGPMLARGYLDHPELTAQRFTPDPFSTDPGARLYRTGDRARYLGDGNLECLGRIDRQLKVRGFRIEPDEIEAVLAGHPGVRQAALAPVTRDGGGTRLVAYVVAADLPAPSNAALRSYLTDRIPDYMVPAIFVWRDALPLTTGGKLDRLALLDLDDRRPDVDAAFQAPRDGVEAEVAAIWKELLGLSEVGANDNFFQLGGHSLLATQVVARIDERFGVEVPLRRLFEAPTVERLAESIAAVKAASGDRQGPVLGPRPWGEEAAPSYAQERMWFLDQWVPDRPLYNIPVPVRVTGDLDVSLLERSLNEIVRRHEVLRSRFPNIDGHARLEIAASLALTVPVRDLRALSDSEREVEARRWVQADAERGFDLAGGPLLRAGLLRLGEEDQLLLLTLHHIVADGWSLRLVLQELAALYAAFAAGRPSPLPDLPLQYADFAAWQRNWLTGEALDEQLAYWTRQLDGAPPSLDLPADRPRPAFQNFDAGHHQLDLSRTIAQQVTHLGRRASVTPFMVVLAALTALLARYTSQTDVVVGSPVAGRGRRELGALIGPFINTLVLRTDLAGNPTVMELLRRVRDTAVGAYAHQDLPFERLVDELQPERDLSRTPLFQVLFVFQPALDEALHAGALTLSPITIDGSPTRCDLTVTMQESARGLRTSFEYDRDLFDAGTIARLARHFEILLEAMLADPQQRLDKLPLLQPDERRLIDRWNATAVAYPQPECLPALIEAQVQRTPDAIAVIAGALRLSYRELDARANQLANALRRLGVGPEIRVAVCMQRSLELVVALLGILKAGGAYVPLDPGYPKERRAVVLEDAAAAVTITQPELLEELPDTSGAVLCLEPGWVAIAGEREEPPPCGAGPNTPAYVIYTSGSTGRPKGVVIDHRGICNRLRWMQDAYHLDETDRVMQKTPFTFDVSVWEFFWPLISGARLVMADAGGHRDPAYLAGLIVEQGITTLHFVPSMLSVFLEQEQPRRLESLRRVICSGEALGVDLQARFFAACPGVELHNLYGPTEASVDVSAWTCVNETGAPGVPIGRPIANTQLYVLDAAGQPAPPGVAGELHIAGVGLARGYLQRPDLTAERFVPNPFHAEPGSRMYRSGDLARFRPDGVIDYLGRIDHQLKMRGVRIEPGEIETALAAHPSVRAALVVAREDRAGERRLVAYLLPASGEATPGSDALRDFAAQRLPDVMVPSAFSWLDAFPLTASGKLDRRAFPEPDWGTLESAERFIPPRTPVEEVLAGIWGEVLSLDRVGVHDHFFRQGGHSLSAVALITRIRGIFRVDLPLRAVFESPTIAQLATVLAAREARPGQHEKIALLIQQIKGRQ